MPTSFPTSRDALTNPTASDPKNSATVPHASQHANANDAIEAIETLLPITSEGSVPRGTRGYAQVTASQTGLSAETDLTSLSVTVTVGAGRRIRVTGEGGVTATAANARVYGRIKEGTTELQRWSDFFSPSAGAESHAVGSVILTPGAGSHTYKLSLERISGTGTVGLVAATTSPAYILVEDIGAA